MTERLTCDLCDEPVEPGQPRMGMKGDGGESGSRYGRERHYACHEARFGRKTLAPALRETRAPTEPRPAMKAPKVTRGEYNRSENVARTFRTFGQVREMGRSRVDIECPFCLARFWAFIWSISGGGKKCPNCGAMHGSFGQAFPLAGNEDL